MSAIDPFGDSRRALLDLLTYMHNLLRYVDERWAAKTAVAERYRLAVRLPKKWGVLPFLACAAGLDVVLTLIAHPLIQAMAQADAQAQGSIYYTNIEPLNVGILMIPLALILAFLVVLLRNKLILPRRLARAAQTNREVEAHNAAVWAEEQQINTQLLQAGQDYTQNIPPDFFPQAYLTEDVVLFCIDVVRNQRANTVGEAINLYETHAMHSEQLAAAERTRKQIAIGTVINAAMTGAAIGTMRSEGRANRESMNANAERITDQLKMRVNVNTKGR